MQPVYGETNWDNSYLKQRKTKSDEELFPDSFSLFYYLHSGFDYLICFYKT